MAFGIPASLSNRAASPVTTVLPTPTGPVTSRTGTGAVTRSGALIRSSVADLREQMSVLVPAQRTTRLLLPYMHGPRGRLVQLHRGQHGSAPPLPAGRSRTA